MLILQKDFITMDLVKQEQGVYEYRLDITLQVNGKLKRTGVYVFKKMHQPSQIGEGMACGPYDEIDNLTTLESVLNILIDLGYEIGNKNDIFYTIDQYLQQQ